MFFELDLRRSSWFQDRRPKSLIFLLDFSGIPAETNNYIQNRRFRVARRTFSGLNWRRPPLVFLPEALSHACFFHF